MPAYWKGTPLDAMKESLEFYIQTVPDVQRMAAGSEALRMLKENNEMAEQLFDCAVEPPSSAQLHYLNGLGYKGEMPKSKGEASYFIQKTMEDQGITKEMVKQKQKYRPGHWNRGRR